MSFDRDVDRIVAGRKPIRRGSVASLKGHKVSVGGRRTATVDELATEIFADHDLFTREAKQGRAALLADPVVTDEVIELERSTVFTRTTRMVVTDAKKLRQSSPTFAKFRGGGGKAVAFDDLDPTIRAGIEKYKQEIDRFPSDHPLKRAAAKGDQALLDAIASGVGDFSMTVTVDVPKHGMKTDAAGKIVAPALGANGTYEKPTAGGGGGAQATLHRRFDSRTTTETGTCAHTYKLLAGETKGDGWDFSVEVDFGVGLIRLGASAWYGYGLRIPIQVTATQTPNRIATEGGRDVASNFDVTLTANTLDAPASHYTEVGLPASDVHEGHELVLEAGAAVTIFVKVAGVKLVDATIPGNGGFDFGKNFRPPFADCGTNCGFEVWIPHTVTRTGITFLGVTGSARVGVKVTGDGDVNLGYEALINGRAVDSWRDGAKSEATKTHDITFETPTGTRTRTAEIQPIEREKNEKTYGYRLTNPSYDWSVDLIPGLRGDIDIDWKIYREHVTIGPFWLGGLKLDLGTYRFPTHAGTTSTVESEHGEKSWTNTTPPDALQNMGEFEKRGSPD
jgi:hypothetical protein